MSNFTEQLDNINTQVDDLVKIYNEKQTLNQSHLEKIIEIQKKLDIIGLNPVGNSQPKSVPGSQTSKENSIFSSFSRLNPFKAKPTSGGRYSHKRKSVKRRSTKKGGRKHK
jgi:hypothetical protein